MIDASVIINTVTVTCTFTSEEVVVQATLSVQPGVNINATVTPQSVGLKGESAYEIAVRNGFEGTESEWIESISSPSGPTVWDEIENKPTEFQPSTHSHSISQVTELQSALDSKQPSGNYANQNHSHSISEVQNLQASLDSKQASGSYANAAHNHAISDVTNLQSTLDGKAASSHNHSIESVNGLEAALNGKAENSHSHQISHIAGLESALDSKQPLGSYAASVHSHAISDVSGLALALAAKAENPSGVIKAVQYNNDGALASANDVQIEDGQLRLLAIADPTIPAAGGIKIYGSLFAGRILPKIIGPAGVDTALQVGLHGNSVIMIAPASGTSAPTIWGGTLTTAATMSLQFTPGSSNRWLSTQRKRFQTLTTAGNVSGMRLAYSHCHRGNAANFGGFFFRAQFGMQINLNGGQKFIGLCASTGALAAEPSALLNMCGVGYDAADASTGNWFFMRNGGSGVATRVDLGANAARNITHGYDLIMFMAPNGTGLFVKITNLVTNTVVLDTSYNTDLPAVNVGLSFKAEVRNGAVAAADNLEIAKVYIETDY